MSNDFAPGDVVVCVDDSPCGCGYREAIKRGRSYRVDTVVEGGRGITVVGIPMSPGHIALGSIRFRKIRPASDQFTRQMRELRPLVRERQDA